MSDKSLQNMPPDERVKKIIASYRAARAAGKAPPPEVVIKHFPDLAEQLRPLLAAEAQAHGPTMPRQPVHDTDRIVAAPNRAAPADPNAPTLDPEPCRQPAGPPDPHAATLGPDEPAGEDDSFPVSRDFGDYELLEQIARGGMGIVFRARQKSPSRIVALKMILAGQLASPEQVRRFRIEAEEAGGLDHPNIVPIYQVGEYRSQHFFTMKLIEGGNLADQIDRFRPDARAAARLVCSVARAVHYAHQHGVLHRDLKPGNILLDADGTPHVTDFGLAKHLEGPDTTVSGVIVGTPGYMSPEQARANRNLTVAADIYGLGAIFYELLTGRPPFKAETPLETLRQVTEQEPSRPSTIRRGLDRDLETICLTCLAKEPAKRYASAERMADDLERWLEGEPIRARAAGRIERAIKWAKRRPAIAALVLVSVLAIVALTVGGWWTSGKLRAARDEAQGNADDARTQKERAEASFRSRLETIDDFLIRFDNRLAKAGTEPSIRLEFLDDALKLNQQLLAEDPTNPAARRQAGRLYMNLGDLSGDEAAYFQALQFQRALASEFPDKTEYSNDLAITLAHQAQLLRRAKDHAGALAALDEAIRLQDALAERPSTVQLEYRSRGALYRFERANVLEAQGLKRQGELGYKDALRRQEELVAQSPRALHYADMAATHFSLASLAAETSTDAALDHWKDTFEAWRQALRLVPKSREYAGNLNETYRDVRDLLRKENRHAGLAELAEQLCQDFPSDNNATYNAACMMSHATLAAEQEKQLSEPERTRLVDSYGAQTVKLLDRAVHEGFRDRTVMDHDSDLDPVRKRKDYEELVANLEKRNPTAANSPARQLAAMERDYEDYSEDYDVARRRARTVAEKKRADAKRVRLEKSLRDFIRFAEKYRDTAAAVEALVWVIESAVPNTSGKIAPDMAKLREDALAALQRDHLQKPELANVCVRLSKTPEPDCEELLKAAMEKGAQQDVRGLAAFALGLSLSTNADRMLGRDEIEANRLLDRAEKQMELVVKQFAAIPYGKTTLGEVAREKLHELRFLTVGRTAQEIEGVDLNGKKFKLSDHRGKIVVLDFWADWCGFCRRMYPYEKSLVQRMKGQPFALLGVNCDDQKATALRALEKEKLNWPSLWDGGKGGDRFATAWQIDSFPTIYVLDGNGVIRFKIRGANEEELDAAINALLREQAGKE